MSYSFSENVVYIVVGCHFCRVLNFALLFETVLAFALIYIPGINSGLQMEMLFPTAWFPCLPFVILGRGSIIPLMRLVLTFMIGSLT